MKCEKCSKKVNKANLKGLLWNDWPLSKPKIDWLCPECYRKNKSKASRREKAALETKWWILDQFIDAKRDGDDLSAETWKEAYPEYSKFIEEHIELSCSDLKVVQLKIKKMTPSGTTSFEQTLLVKPGDPFLW